MKLIKGFPLIKRVAIVDIGAHHGNGTEEILKSKRMPDRILFCSIHQYCKESSYQYYPGTGAMDDVKNNIYNFPLSPVNTSYNRAVIIESIHAESSSSSS